MTLTAQCLRRGTNVVFARGEVTSSDGRLVALATATFVHTA
jgi:acyl-coenzyme A thioesterase PaaI-like protein